MKTPATWTLTALWCYCHQGPKVLLDNIGYHSARPIHPPSVKQRFRAAWLVFTGKADAVFWPGSQ